MIESKALFFFIIFLVVFASVYNFAYLVNHGNPEENDKVQTEMRNSEAEEKNKTTYVKKERSNEYTEIRNPQTYGETCQRKLDLSVYKEEDHKEGEMYFLETSGRSWLTPRQSCSVESAARRSNLTVNVLFLSTFVDLYDNSTCYLSQTVNNVNLYTFDLSKIFKDTPLDGVSLNSLTKLIQPISNFSSTEGKNFVQVHTRQFI